MGEPVATWDFWRKHSKQSDHVLQAWRTSRAHSDWNKKNQGEAGREGAHSVKEGQVPRLSPGAHPMAAGLALTTSWAARVPPSFARCPRCLKCSDRSLLKWFLTRVAFSGYSIKNSTFLCPCRSLFCLFFSPQWHAKPLERCCPTELCVMIKMPCAV